METLVTLCSLSLTSQVAESFRGTAVFFIYLLSDVSSLPILTILFRPTQGISWGGSP